MKNLYWKLKSLQYTSEDIKNEFGKTNQMPGVYLLLDRMEDKLISATDCLEDCHDDDIAKYPERTTFTTSKWENFETELNETLINIAALENYVVGKNSEACYQARKHVSEAIGYIKMINNTEVVI